MNARSTPQDPSRAPESRFGPQFIEDHKLIERYLENKLPVKGARELENYCRANPGYLDALRLCERTAASLKLLEASGTAPDLSAARPPWWKAPYVPIVLGTASLVLLLGLWALYGRYTLVRSERDDARVKLQQGTLEQPAVESTLRITPDRVAGLGRAKISVNHAAPQLMDLHIDLGYSKAMQFRVVIDKKEQGRALILNGVQKDSNGELRVTFNTTGLSPGTYTARLEALPAHGASVEEGWLTLDVR